MLSETIKTADHVSVGDWTAKTAMVALVYFVAGKLGLLLPSVDVHITLIWLPTGIAVAALLRWGKAMWPGVFLAALAVNLSVSSVPSLAVSIAIGNTLAPLLTAGLLKFARFNQVMDKPRDIFLLLVAAAIGMLVSATGGVVSLKLLAGMPAGNMLLAWLTWWAGDFVGVLLAAPLLMNISSSELGNLWRQRFEYTIWLAITCVTCWGIFFLNLDAEGHSLQLVFLILPIVVWSSMRFNLTGASVGTLICILIAVLATSQCVGPFNDDVHNHGLIVMWVFMSTLVLVQLMVTALQTQRNLAEARIRSLAFFDPLTRLPNRNLLLDRLRQAMYSSVRNLRYGAVMFLDLDHFKNINDAYGHDVGDSLLKEVARRLLLSVRKGDTVSRLSGDEFVVVLENLDQDKHRAAKQAEIVAEKIRATLADIFHLTITQNYSTTIIDYYTSVSIGISFFRDKADQIDELLKRADLTMYQAKSAGRNAIRFFDPSMQKLVEHRSMLEACLRQSIEKNELKLHYQLQVDRNGRPTGCEALLRWYSAQEGVVPPVEFIPLAEETSLILPIGNWVIDQACRQLVAWSSRPETCELSLAINVSARQFREANFVALIDAAIKRHAIMPPLLKLELTEGVVINDIDEAVFKMHQLKLLGVTISLDDFGTGYSSLSYLQRLPLDQLKIDQSFVRNILNNESDAAITLAIINLGKTLGLDVIAEGVETQQQYDYLLVNDCEEFQGYLFARPEPIEIFEKLITEKYFSAQGNSD